MTFAHWLQWLTAFLIVVAILAVAAGVRRMVEMEQGQTPMRVLAILLALLGMPAFAHDSNHWGDTDPAVRLWMQGLMQPDNPTASCCGEADAYWADEVHFRDGKTYATITDDRDDAPLGRPHVDNGTEIEIPDHKLKWDRGNPTGHGVVFLSRGGFVYCFVQPGGA